MSVRVLSWAWQVDCVSSGEKLVLLALADHAGEDGTCYPLTAALSSKSGLSNSTVRGHLDALEERGVLSRKRRRRRDGKLGGYLYALHTSTADPSAVEATADAPALDGHEDHRRPVRTGLLPTAQRRSTTRPPPTGDRSTADPSARGTVTEPSLEPSLPPGEQLASSPRPVTDRQLSGKQRIIAGYVAGYGERRKRRRPPKSWLGALERITDRALADGADVDELVTVASTIGVEGKHPRVLLHVLADFLADEAMRVDIDMPGVPA